MKTKIVQSLNVNFNLPLSHFSKACVIEHLKLTFLIKLKFLGLNSLTMNYYQLKAFEIKQL